MPVRIALANLPFPESPQASVQAVLRAVEQAASGGATIVCFPECFVPGYRSLRRALPPPHAGFLETAWAAAARSAARASVTLVLGTERLVNGYLVPSSVVIAADGSISGFQDKVQIDPSEEGTYTPGTDRRMFQAGALVFGVVICHEGWRYPETVRWAARRGAHIIFHQQFHEAEGDSFRPTSFGQPGNTFHESAVLCRAAENTCYFATANYASAGSPTTSAVANPDGTLLAYQPYGQAGLLLVDIDPAAATGLLARRYKPLP